MRKLLAWLEDHPITAFFAAMVILVVGGHFFANWRAECRWQAYCEAARARGAKISMEEIIPPEIPESENFAALPMFRGLFTTAGKRPMNLRIGHGDFPGFGKPLKGERLDWKAWQAYLQSAGLLEKVSDNAPRDVLQALDHFGPQMAEWSGWRTRPRCRFPVDYKVGFTASMPHLYAMKEAAELFSLRMEAHLALGESETAYADFQEGMQSYRALSEEPSLIAGLVQLSAVSSLVSSIGVGLCDHHWSAEDLQKIEHDLESVHFGLDYQRSVSTERAFVNSIYDLILDASPLKRGKLLANLSASGVSTWPFVVIPRRIFRDNQLRSNEEVDRLLSMVKTDGASFSLSSEIPSKSEPLEGFGEIYYFMHRLITSSFESIPDGFARRETRVRQARIACAIERFRIAKGTFPDSLAELVPAYLAAIPQDFYSGQPMIYRRKSGGSFLLYSVGPNRVDDQGIVDPNIYEHKQPDVVWYFAPVAAP